MTKEQQKEVYEFLGDDDLQDNERIDEFELEKMMEDVEMKGGEIDVQLWQQDWDTPNSMLPQEFQNQIRAKL